MDNVTPTECEYVYDAFDGDQSLIKWDELHGKTFRLCVAKDDCTLVVSLLDERSGKKYVIHEDIRNHERA